MVHENLARIREAKKITKTYIAKQLGMSLMGYSHIESGNVRLDVERLIDISNILDVPVHIFFYKGLTDSVISELLNKEAKQYDSYSTITCEH